MRNERVNCFLQMADSLQSTCPKCSVLNKLPNRLDNIHCSAVEALTVHGILLTMRSLQTTALSTSTHLSWLTPHTPTK